MNIMYLTINNMVNLEGTNIHSGLIKEFISHGHYVTIISPIQKRQDTPDNIIKGKGYEIHKPHIGNITNTGFLEKGISAIGAGKKINRYISKMLPKAKIDLLVLTVPPVTYDDVVQYVRKKYHSKVYLLLKDFWPASLFDVDVRGGNIVKRMACFYLRCHEKSLYSNSDFIGCMSEANVKYLLEHNDYISKDKVHVNPNVITVKEYKKIDVSTRTKIREKYGIPLDKTCFIYGGTLGVGQNVKHIAACMRACKDLDCHFIIAGQGVQYHYLEEYVNKEKPKNFTLFKWLPQEEYELLMRSCDVGMVFLRYTAQTPNIPSRILTYMSYGLPIVSCTDPVTDLKEILVKGEFGTGCLSDDPSNFREMIVKMIANPRLLDMGEKARLALEREYCPNVGYNTIIKCYDK